MNIDMKRLRQIWINWDRDELRYGQIEIAGYEYTKIDMNRLRQICIG